MTEASIAGASSTYSLQPSSGVADRYVRNLETLLDYYLTREGRDREAAEPQLRFAWSLARHRFTPPDGECLREKTQVMIFGGAGAGKSTTVNILLGIDGAEVNAQAGYTRHPTAFYCDVRPAAPEDWPDNIGKLQRSDRAAPAIVDEDRFSVIRLEPGTTGNDFMFQHVVWDCPDLTTQKSTRYENRVIEIAGLADVGVYVASDERYNDELPTNFLQAMLEAGKPVVVALTKASPSDADEFVRLFREQVTTKLRKSELIVDVVAIPAPADGRVSNLWSGGSPPQRALRSAVVAAAGELSALRVRSRDRAAEFLKMLQHRLLDPLRYDLAEFRAWIELVRKAANEAVQRFEREHLLPRSLTTSTDPGVIRLFSTPSPFTPVNRFMDYLREPYRFVRSFWTRRLLGFDRSFDRQRELAQVCKGIVETLRVQCSARLGRHRLWSEIRDSLDEAEKTAESQLARLQKTSPGSADAPGNGAASADAWISNPLAAFTAQGLRLVVETTAILLIGYWSGFQLLTLLLALLAMGLIEESIQAAASLYGRRQRETQVRNERERVRETIKVAYLDVLTRLPPRASAWLLKLAGVEQQLSADLEALAGSGDRR